MNNRVWALTLALILCLGLPLTALGEGKAADYHFTFEMNPDKYPLDQQEILAGIADGVNILSIAGDATYDGKKYDVTGAVAFHDKPLLTLRLYGLDSIMEVESNALGDQTVRLMMLAYSEFAMKAYHHLGLPLQYFALLTSSYTHTITLDPILALFHQTFDGEGTRSYTAAQVLDFIDQVVTYGNESREFYYWIASMLMDLGADDAFYELFNTTGEWAGTLMGDQGLTVTVEGDTETWAAGESTLFVKTVSPAGQTWTLTLPDREGYLTRAQFTDETNPQGRDVALTVDIAGEAGQVLGVSLAAEHLPSPGLTEAGTTFAADLTGSMLPQETHTRFDAIWQRTDLADGHFAMDGAIRQLDAVTGETMLAIRGGYQTKTPEKTLTYTHAELEQVGVNIFSVYEETLKAFMESITLPALKTLPPILAEIPGSCYQSIFALLEQYGIVDLLTDGIGYSAGA